MKTNWIITAILTAIALGICVCIFVYARGASYLTDSSEACTNCHVMQTHYEAWLNSSHRSVTTCNSCHTPPDFWGKNYTKALNGYFHSLAMVTGRFQEPIRIGPRNQQITESACRNCHQDLGRMQAHPDVPAEISCMSCHSGVGHQFPLDTLNNPVRVP